MLWPDPNDLLPVLDVENMDGIDLDALPDLPPNGDGLTLDDLLPVLDMPEMGGIDIDALDDMPASSRRQ